MGDLKEENINNQLEKEKNNFVDINLPSISTFKDRLKYIIGSDSGLSFALKCGISESVLRQYLKGLSEPTLSKIASICAVTNTPIDWLVTGNEVFLPANKDNTLIDIDLNNYVLVNDLNIQVAAGNGIVPLNGVEPVGKFILSNDWLRVNRLLNKKLAIFHVNGDSMEPTICDDDIALVSLVEDSWTSALSGVFILRVDDALFIKRIQVDMIEKGIHIISDNPIYQRNFIKIDETTESKITIIAKVERILTKASPRNG